MKNKQIEIKKAVAEERARIIKEIGKLKFIVSGYSEENIANIHEHGQIDAREQIIKELEKTVEKL